MYIPTQHYKFFWQEIYRFSPALQSTMTISFFMEDPWKNVAGLSRYLEDKEDTEKFLTPANTTDDKRQDFHRLIIVANRIINMGVSVKRPAYTLH